MLRTALLQKCIVYSASPALQQRVCFIGSSCTLKQKPTVPYHFARSHRCLGSQTTLAAMSQQAKQIQALTSDPSKFDTLDHLQIAQVDVPEPGQGEVLVAIRLRPVNPTDIAQSKGLYGDGRDGKPFSVG